MPLCLEGNRVAWFGANEDGIMSHDFVSLAFGFCVALTGPPERNLDFGYLASGECVFHRYIELGEGFRYEQTILGHDVVVRGLEGGAEIKIDDLTFTVQETTKT